MLFDQSATDRVQPSNIDTLKNKLTKLMEKRLKKIKNIRRKHTFNLRQNIQKSYKEPVFQNFASFVSQVTTTIQKRHNSNTKLFFETSWFENPPKESWVDFEEKQKPFQTEQIKGQFTLGIHFLSVFLRSCFATKNRCAFSSAFLQVYFRTKYRHLHNDKIYFEKFCV